MRDDRTADELLCLDLRRESLWVGRRSGFTARKMRESADRIDQLRAELDRFYRADDEVELFSPRHEANQRGELTVWFRAEPKP